MRIGLLSLLCLLLCLTACTVAEETSFDDSSAFAASSSPPASTAAPSVPTAAPSAASDDDTVQKPPYTAPKSGQFLRTVSQSGRPLSAAHNALLTAYFTHRADSFARAEGLTAADPEDLSVSREVRALEEERTAGLQSLKTRWGCHFAGAQTVFSVESLAVEADGVTALCIYESVCFYHWYEGFSAPDTADLSGYGVRHVLRVNGDTVLSDHYNEGSATGVAAAGRLDDERYTQYAGAESQAEKKTAPVITADTGTAAFPDGFDPSRAIAYADRFALGRNLSRYPDLHTLGGDCANFVSQCLQAGGLPFAGDWYWEGGAAGSGGRAFKAATWLYRHLTADVRCGKPVAMIEDKDPTGRTAVYAGQTRSAASLFCVGSPVFYRFSGGFADDGDWSHAAICVGLLADGTPAVSCHSEDRYRFKWNYGGDSCEYGTVWLTDSPAG